MTSIEYENMKHRWETPKQIDPATNPWILVLDEKKSDFKLISHAKIADDVVNGVFRTGYHIQVLNKNAYTTYIFLSGVLSIFYSNFTGTKEQMKEAKKSIQVHSSQQRQTRMHGKISTPDWATPVDVAGRNKRAKKRSHSPVAESRNTRARPESGGSDCSVLSETSPSSLSQDQPPTSATPNLPQTSSPTSNTPNIPPTSSPTSATPNLPPSSPTSNTPNIPPTSSPTSATPNLPTSSPTSATPNLPPTSSPTSNTPNLPPTSSPTSDTPNIPPTSSPTSDTPNIPPTSATPLIPSVPVASSPRNLFPNDFQPNPKTTEEIENESQTLRVVNSETNTEMVDLFSVAVELINGNLNFNDFMQKASETFIYSLQSLSLLRIKAIAGTYPVEPLKSKAPWDFKQFHINIYQNKIELYEFNIFKLSGMEPLNFNEVRKEIRSKVDPIDDNNGICNYTNCCESNRYEGLKQDVKYHISHFHYAFICCLCGIILRDSDTLNKHCRESCKRAGYGKTKNKVLKNIDNDDGNEGEGVGDDNEEANPTKFTNVGIVTEANRNLAPLKPNLESKIIMAATASVLSDITHSDSSVTIPGISNFPCYYLSKAKRFVIYNLGNKKNVTNVAYEAALEAINSQEQKLTCNFSDCMYCQDEKFVTNDQKEMVNHIRSQFRLGCPICKSAFVSILDLDKHYSENCLEDISKINSTIMKQRKETKYQKIQQQRLKQQQNQ